MVLRKMAVVCGVVACGAVAGLLGQSLVAGANAPAPSDKTLYAQANPKFVDNLTVAAGPAKTLLRVTVHAPSAGTAEVRVDSQLWTDFPSTTTAELSNVLTVGRCRGANTLLNMKCKAKTTYWFHKPQDQFAQDSTFAYSLSALLSFSSAGTRTLYLNARSDEYPAGLWADDFSHVQVAFTPSHPISAGAHIQIAVATPGAELD